MSTDSDPNRAAIADTVVDRENPWPGLRAYDERGKDYFKGRRDVARDLLRLIVREDLVLLYGISGLGKTSLLKAGVFPDLPPNFLPVYLRLNFVSAEAQDARNGRRPLASSDLAAQVVAATEKSARQRNVEPPSRPPVPERGLWEYFRRADDGFWGPGGLLMTPVLVFDQFEELFTRVESPNAAQRHFDEFLHDLANLESGHEPPWYESACATDEIMERPTYTRQPGVCKVVLSFREDYLANVKGLSRIIPSIDRIFLRLEPMTRKAAARAICEAGQHLIEGHGTKQTLRTSVRIIRKVTGAPGRLAETSTVDPALLSLFCRELNEKRKATSWCADRSGARRQRRGLADSHDVLYESDARRPSGHAQVRRGLAGTAGHSIAVAGGRTDGVCGRCSGRRSRVTHAQAHPASRRRGRGGALRVDARCARRRGARIPRSPSRSGEARAGA